jgi:predicted DNA binding CopG/RHH family protein
MEKQNKKAFDPLDQEEKELMESIDRDEWRSVKNIDQEKKKAIQAARNTLKKEKRINLRLTQKDYHQIQIKAIEEGIPYQTLISSIVHKYLNGSLSWILRNGTSRKTKQGQVLSFDIFLKRNHFECVVRNAGGADKAEVFEFSIGGETHKSHTRWEKLSGRCWGITALGAPLGSLRFRAPDSGKTVFQIAGLEKIPSGSLSSV